MMAGNSLMSGAVCMGIETRDYCRMIDRVRPHRHSFLRDLQDRRERGTAETAKEFSIRKQF
jgi:hypothetical protein